MKEGWGVRGFDRFAKGLFWPGFRVRERGEGHVKCLMIYNKKDVEGWYSRLCNQVLEIWVREGEGGKGREGPKR